MTNIGLPMSPGAARAEQAAREREGWQAYTSKQLVDLTARITAIEERVAAFEARDRKDVDA